MHRELERSKANPSRGFKWPEGSAYAVLDGGAMADLPELAGTTLEATKTTAKWTGRERRGREGGDLTTAKNEGGAAQIVGLNAVGLGGFWRRFIERYE